MQNDQLLADLKGAGYPFDGLPLLQTAEITTYSALFALLRDEGQDEALRVAAAEALILLWKTVDKRRAVPPLLVALRSSSENVRASVARALMIMRSRQATIPLAALAGDKAEAEVVRLNALHALGSIRDTRAAPALKRIIEDRRDHLNVRATALEQLPDTDSEDDLNYYIGLLSDSEADIRFWAVFRLAGTAQDISRARAKLDEIVAFDHAVPQYFGWHVDREAILMLERIDYYQYHPTPELRDGGFWAFDTWMISPTPEYSTFQKYRYRQDADHDEALKHPELVIDQHWLRAQIAQRWTGAAFGVRQPPLQAYALDWQVMVDGSSLMGALHRDRYAVVLTGQEEAVKTFAHWYRTIIPTQHTLYLYEWAGEGVLIETQKADGR